jgi:hypothetical protein
MSSQMEAWVSPSGYPDTVPFPGYVDWSYTVVSKECYPDQEWAIFVNRPYNNVTGQPINSAGVCIFGGGWNCVSDVIALTTNTWHHIAFTFEGNIVTLYRDGQMIGSVTAPFIPTPIKIGMSSCTNISYNPWVGAIDEVAVWNEALSDCDIYRHYLNGLEFRVGYMP